MAKRSTPALPPPRFTADDLAQAALASRAASRNPSGLAHVPTDATRELVAIWAQVGTPPDIIAHELGLDPRTFKKHYADELQDAEHKGVARVAQVLFGKAMRGDTTAAIFFLKARGKLSGWIDTREEDKPSTVVQLDIVQAITSTIAALRQGTMPAARTVDATTAPQSPPALQDGRDLL